MSEADSSQSQNRRRGRRGGRRRPTHAKDGAPRARRDSQPQDAPEAEAALETVAPDAEPEAAGQPKADWQSLKLSPPLLHAMARLKFKAPTDIQRELIPVALQHKDVIGQARTGTGKTAAFAIPIIQQLEIGAGTQALILAPTRELAAQVEEHIQALGKETGVRTVTILGGRRIKQQLDALKKRPEVIVGTPGRVLDLMHRKELDIRKLRFAVLDEVDRMLDIGFRDDIRKILRSIEAPHQTIFVSATLDDEIQKLARTFMNDPVEVNVSHDMLTVDQVQQGFVSVHPHDKFNTLLGFLKHEAPHLAIVFTNTKHKARRLAQFLRKEGINCKEIHGDLVQEKRDRVMQHFRDAKIHVLVATDLASRGLDVMDISHIVNFDVPADPAAYVHRIGRTARMGKTGYAVMLVTAEEGESLTKIEKLINREIPQFEAPWLVKRAPSPAQVAAAVAKHQAAPVEVSGVILPQRLKEPARRDEVLERYYGLRPIRRTLGSRFRSPRKRR